MHEEAPLTHMALWLGLSHKLQVKTDILGMQLHVSLSNSEEHIEDIGRIVHIYFSSANKKRRHNKQQNHKVMAIYYPP